MRVWLSPQTGTGGHVTTPIPVEDQWETAPDDWADPEVPEFQTEYTTDDPYRATHQPGAGLQRPIVDAPDYASSPVWVVLDLEATDAPAGALDMGDPSLPGWGPTLLTTAQKTQLQSQLGGTVAFWDQDRTRGEILRLFTGEDRLVVSVRRAAGRLGIEVDL